MKDSSAAQFFLDEHKVIHGMLCHALSAQERGHEEESAVARQALAELQKHVRLFHDVLEPVLAGAAQEELRAATADTVADHEEIVGAIAELLDSGRLDDDSHRKGLRELIETVEDHFESEERNVLGPFEKHFAADQERLGQDLQRLSEARI